MPDKYSAASDKVAHAFQKMTRSIDEKIKQADETIRRMDQGTDQLFPEFKQQIKQFSKNQRALFNDFQSSLNETEKARSQIEQDFQKMMRGFDEPLANVEQAFTHKESNRNHFFDRPNRATSNRTSETKQAPKSVSTEFKTNRRFNTYQRDVERKDLSNSERYHNICDKADSGIEVPKGFTDKYDGSVFILPMNLPCLLHGKTYDFKTLENVKTSPDTHEPFSQSDIQPDCQTQNSIDVFLTSLENEHGLTDLAAETPVGMSL